MGSFDSYHAAFSYAECKSVVSDTKWACASLVDLLPSLFQKRDHFVTSSSLSCKPAPFWKGVFLKTKQQQKKNVLLRNNLSLTYRIESNCQDRRKNVGQVNPLSAEGTIYGTVNDWVILVRRWFKMCSAISSQAKLVGRKIGVSMVKHQTTRKQKHWLAAYKVGPGPNLQPRGFKRS